METGIPDGWVAAALGAERWTTTNGCGGTASGNLAGNCEFVHAPEVHICAMQEDATMPPGMVDAWALLERRWSAPVAPVRADAALMRALPKGCRG